MGAIAEFETAVEESGTHYLGWSPVGARAVRRWWVPVLTGVRVCGPIRIPREGVRRVTTLDEDPAQEEAESAVFAPLDPDSVLVLRSFYWGFFDFPASVRRIERPTAPAAAATAVRSSR